jgi:hypothetical protein
MGTTPRYRLRYLDRYDPANGTRAVLQDNAETTEAALTRIAGYVDQLATVVPGGQTYIGLDTDGTPYFDPAGSVASPAGVGVDTDGVPYVVAFTDRSTL